MKRTMMWCLFILCGIGFLAYPTFSDWYNQLGQEQIIEAYSKNTEKLEEPEIIAEREKALQYNKSLKGEDIVDPFVPGSGAVLPDNYLQVLNIDGVMGHIEIPKIQVSLPIYHGTSEEVLQKGVGHLDMTSLPVGGIGNHSVLTGHCGLSHAKMFTDLEKLQKGDLFYVYVLDEILAYKVDQITVVDPNDTEQLMPDKNKDYMTLVTCTPYAVNSHRLLVRGVRTEYSPDTMDHIQSSILSKNHWLLLVFALAIILVLVVMVVNILKHKR